MKRIFEKYGKVNVVISIICICVLILNSIFVDTNVLKQLSDNTIIAYIINFAAGCEGILGDIGSMSKNFIFVDGQWWRVFTHIYLHAGVLHMIFNVFALLFAGKIVEKKVGSLQYAILFNVIAIVNALILCFVFPDSISVGASAGIFGMIGILCTLIITKDNDCKNNLKKGEKIYLIIFSVLSLILGFESFITHLLAFVIGFFIGFILKKYCCNL